MIGLLRRWLGLAQTRSALSQTAAGEASDRLVEPPAAPDPFGAAWDADMRASPAPPGAVRGTPPRPPSPPPAGSAQPMRRRLSVGRSPHNDIVLDDAGLSRTHMYILLDDTGAPRARLIDTLSDSGIHVLSGGEFVRVRDGAVVGFDDTIRLGNTETTVRSLLQGGADTPDVFISYAREDEAVAREVEGALEAHGWRPWRDSRLGVARSFDEEIERKLKAARCVAVLWSARSARSQAVRSEASVALERQVLVPVFIEDIEIPLMFRLIQGCFLTAGEAGERAEQMAVLVAKLEGLIGSPRPAAAKR